MKTLLVWLSLLSTAAAFHGTYFFDDSASGQTETRTWTADTWQIEVKDRDGKAISKSGGPWKIEGHLYIEKTAYSSNADPATNHLNEVRRYFYDRTPKTLMLALEGASKGRVYKSAAAAVAKPAAPPAPVAAAAKVPAPPPAPSRETIRKFVEDVSLKTLTGNDQRVCRWASPPSISLFNPIGQAGEDVFTHAVTQINEALQPAKFQISVMAPGEPRAEICFAFADRSDLASLARRFAIKQYDGRDFGHSYWWNENHEIYKAVIVMSTKQQSLDQAREDAMQMLAAVLGFTRGGELPSILGRHPNSRQPTTKLTDLDKQVLPFFFSHLRPGDKAFEVRRAFDREWK